MDQYSKVFLQKEIPLCNGLQIPSKNLKVEQCLDLEGAYLFLQKQDKFNLIIQFLLMKDIL